MVDTVIIRDVELRAQVGGRVLYRITAENGSKYATYDPWMASLCKEAKRTGRQVQLHSSSGWWYRDLSHVALVPTETEQSA